MLFTIAGFKGVDYMAELREARPANVRVFFIGDDCPAGRDAICAASHARVARVRERAGRARSRSVGVDDVINMQYTSGTTGFPKGVMLSSRNIVNNGYWIGEGLGYTPADRLCLCVPLFHCFGCVLGVLAAYTHGACLCPLEFFEPLRALETVDREKCTALYGVPTMFLAELEHPGFRSLRHVVAADGHHGRRALSRAADAARDRRRCICRELTIVYGLTETSPGLTQTPRDADLIERTQTVGRVMPETEVRIVDPQTGADVPTGVDGELWARGYAVMKGYYEMPEATAAAITPDGWLRSGDQASIDARRPRPHHRPHQGHHHSRRREHRAEGSRGRAAHASGDRRRVGVCGEERVLRRRSRRGAAAASGRDDRSPKKCARSAAIASPDSRFRSSCASSKASR